MLGRNGFAANQLAALTEQNAIFREHLGAFFVSAAKCAMAVGDFWSWQDNLLQLQRLAWELGVTDIVFRHDWPLSKSL